MTAKRIIAPGTRFGRLVVLGEAEYSRAGKRRLKCLCDCGTECTPHLTNIRAGSAISCGCFRLERLREEITVHGESKRSKASSEYVTWRSILSRCHTPTNHKYPIYGGRGIVVCEQWRTSFLTFLKDVGRRPSRKHSIDRINNDGNYEPGNVRWATPTEQARNRRSNVWIEHSGKRLLIADWAKELGIDEKLIASRRRRGMATELVLFQGKIKG